MRFTDPPRPRTLHDWAAADAELRNHLVMSGFYQNLRGYGTHWASRMLLLRPP